jgi:hypothetical protein
MVGLLPTELRSQLPKLYAQQGAEDHFVYIKYFFPAANWTWFVTEGEPRGDDFLFFGYVIGLKKEWGLFYAQSTRRSELSRAECRTRPLFQAGNFQPLFSALENGARRLN